GCRRPMIRTSSSTLAACPYARGESARGPARVWKGRRAKTVIVRRIFLLFLYVESDEPLQTPASIAVGPIAAICFSPIVAFGRSQPKLSKSGGPTMSLALYGHPFSSYTQKVLIALYENGTPFEFRSLGPDTPHHSAEWLRRWPLRKFPLVVDGERNIVETSIIIEYLQLAHPGPVRLLPADPMAALDVRFLDRFFDLHVMEAMQIAVDSALKRVPVKSEEGLVLARETLERAYVWLEGQLAGRTWAAGADFTLADCAAAPSLFYADWTHRISEVYPVLRAYRARLLARPSFARAVEEARPFRPNFPLGAPDRD